MAIKSVNNCVLKWSKKGRSKSNKTKTILKYPGYTIIPNLWQQKARKGVKELEKEEENKNGMKILQWYVLNIANK